MKIYIASSWRNEHGVTMLTKELRDQGHEVISWIENNYGEHHNHVTKKMDFETWVNGPESDQSFVFAANGAMNCDLFIYYAPAGKDAAAECGMAYANYANRSVLNKGPQHMWALNAKGEDFGLMRKMFSRWFRTVDELLDATLLIEEPFAP
jgi:hypothetical protein